MKIDRAWLTERGACEDGKDWFVEQGITEPVAGIKNLVAKDHWEWANWLIVRVMTSTQYLAYAIFAAEQVIKIYEEKFPDDKRPRLAIEAAKAVLKKYTTKNRAAAVNAAANATANAACRSASRRSPSVTANAVNAAFSAANAAYTAAFSAANAASSAAAYAANATCAAALKEMHQRIIEYGIGLIS